MAVEFLYDRAVDMYDAMHIIRSVAKGAPVLTKTNRLDFTDYGITAGANTGDGNIYLRPEVGASTALAYRASFITAGGNSTRIDLGSLTVTFNAAARTMVIAGNWVVDHSLAVGDFLQVNSNSSLNFRNGKLYRVLTITSGAGTNDVVTLETFETLTDETSFVTNIIRWHSGGVWELIRDPAGTPVTLGRGTVGRGAIFENGNHRIQIANHSVAWAVADTLTWDLEENELEAATPDQKWAENEYNITNMDANLVQSVEFFLEGVGIAGTESINVNLVSSSSFASDLYNFRLTGADGYVVSSDYDNQPNISPSMWVAGDNAELGVWVSISGDRIAGVIKTQSGSFQHFYAGFGDKLADGDQYVRPFVVGGQNIASAAPDSAQNENSAYYVPVVNGVTTATRADASTLAVRWVDGQWFYVHVGADTGSPFSNVGFGDLWLTWQAHDGVLVSDSGNGTLQHELNFRARTRPAPGDLYQLMPFTVVMKEPAPNVLLELQGVFFVSGFGAISSEDTAIIGDVEYAFFNNGDSVGQADFMALQLTGL